MLHCAAKCSIFVEDLEPDNYNYGKNRTCKTIDPNTLGRNSRQLLGNTKERGGEDTGSPTPYQQQNDMLYGGRGVPARPRLHQQRNKVVTPKQGYNEDG